MKVRLPLVSLVLICACDSGTPTVTPALADNQAVSQSASIASEQRASSSQGTVPSCKVDMDAVETAIKRLEPSYGSVGSDIGCDAPVIPAHVLMCDSSREAGSELWRMGRLDDLAWVYSYENATKFEVDHGNPPRDAEFLAKRDACTDVACLCDTLVAHTNDSLGGESPYSNP